MTKRQFSVLLLSAVASAWLGGATVSTWLRPLPASAQESAATVPEILRAQAFHVVDEKGALRARLGIEASGENERGPNEPVALILYLGERQVVRLEVDNRGASLSLKGLGKDVDAALSAGEAGGNLTLSGTGPALMVTGRNPYLSVAGKSPILLLSGEGDDVLNLNPSALTLSDGRATAVIGRTQVSSGEAGPNQVRSIASLMLFDEEGKAIWSAP
ncbi:MAG: hypothetical protein ACE5JX_11985 [Acidobacteriota bacterium]